MPLCIYLYAGLQVSHSSVGEQIPLSMSKEASAMIAKIPLDLARHIANVYKPSGVKLHA